MGDDDGQSGEEEYYNSAAWWLCLTKLPVPPKQIWMMYSERCDTIWTRGKKELLI